MPEETTPRRRRVRQVMPEELPEEEQAAQQPETAHEEHAVQTAPAQPEPPRRIIIGSGDDEPDFLVSASKVSGAASRRSRQSAPAEPQENAQEKDRRAQEVEQINLLRKGVAYKKKAAAPKAQQNGEDKQSAAPVPPVEPRMDEMPAAVEKPAKPAKSAKPVKRASAARPVPKKKLSKKARAHRARTIRRSVVGVLAAAVLITLVVAAAAGIGRLLDIKQTLDRGDGVFYPNIYVNSIPLEGRTLDEAAALVSQQVTSQITAWRITLRTQDGRSWDITGDDLKMKYDVADQLDQLWAIGHTGASSQRYEQVKALEEAPIMRYTTLSYDMSAINQILTQIKSEVDREPISATKVYDETKWPPYSYTDDTPGQELDITGLSEHIMGMVDRLESGVVDLTPTPVQAPVTRAYLESQIVQLASYETKIGNTSTEGRFANIKLGTEKFDRLIIKSGELVSFNKVTGKRIESNGYQQALELAYGEYVMGWGGGICQVSSTLYNAVVNAGLEVKERTQHSLPSNYVDKGLDATVQDGRLDFVFKNSTSSDIFIETDYYKVGAYYRCKFTIWGRPDPNGYSYKLVSEVVDTIDIPEVSYREDKNAQYVVYDDEQYVHSKGEEGYIVDVYRVTLDSKGLEVAREKVYTDTYKAVAPVTYVGVTPRETPVPDTTPGHID